MRLAAAIRGSMRLSRIVVWLGLFVSFVSLLRVGLPSAIAGTVASDSVAVFEPAAALDSTLIIYPEKGPEFEVDYVGYWSMNTFRFRKVSGETGYLAANTIRSIKDAEQNDRLKAMIRHKSSFGVFDTTPRRRRSYTAWITRPFRQTPERRRRSYFVMDLGGATRANKVQHSRDDGSSFVTGIGGIRNLSSRWGVGGIVQLTSTSDHYRTVAFGVRVRRYLSDVFAVETTHGLYEDFDVGIKNEGGIPYFGELAVTAAGVISFFSRVERHEFSTYRHAFLNDPEKIEGTDTAVYFGLRLGPRPGYLTVPTALIGSLLVAGAISGSTGDYAGPTIP